MEQTNSLAMNMLQTIVGQAAGIPKTGMADGDPASDFQKLLDEKAQEKDPLLEEPAKTPAKPADPAKKPEKNPVQKEEDPVEASKRAQIVIVGQVQPELAGDPVTLQVPGTEEELNIMAGTWEPQIWAYESTPEEIAGSPAAAAEGFQVIDVSDPEADAILEATAPGADNSPAALLEEIGNDQVGKAAQEVVAEAMPQAQTQGEEDTRTVELVDVEQAPQQIFHDVQAAPVKVGETEAPRQPDEMNVVRQVSDQVAQAVQSGESTVTVRLNPENLGEVTVQVGLKENGALAVAITARNDDTRALLERHSINLQELLSSRVRETVEVEIQRGQENQQSQNQQQNYDGRNGHAQDGQRERRQQREHTSSQDFMQQLRLGLIPAEGEL